LVSGIIGVSSFNTPKTELTPISLRRPRSRSGSGCPIPSAVSAGSEGEKVGGITYSCLTQGDEAGLSLNGSNNLSQRHFQRGGEPFDVDQAKVLLASLDRPNVSAVQACPVGKLLLRPASVVAECLYAVPKRLRMSCIGESLGWVPPSHRQAINRQSIASIPLRGLLGSKRIAIGIIHQASRRDDSNESDDGRHSLERPAAF